MPLIGKITPSIFQCITNDFTTLDVLITEERIKHIKVRHPNDYEQYCSYLKEVVEDPDYIIQTRKERTALILKRISDPEEKMFKTILRLTTSLDNPLYKNSIITFMKVNQKEWNRLIRNKEILYKRE